MSIQVVQHNKQTLWLSPQAIELGIDYQYFNPEYLKAEALLTNTAEGRGTVYFFKPHINASISLVLRHFYRGGLIGKILNDQFVYTGAKNSRSAKEMKILTLLQQHKVNVPAPIAARIVKSGIIYTADIITQAISSQELHELLLCHAVENDVWFNVGQQIRAMHNAQVCHYDINVKNVLLSKSNTDMKQVYLIDFDKCLVRAGEHWKPSNLQRFLRSIQKQQSLFPHYNFSEDNWQALLKGYQTSI